MKDLIHNLVFGAFILCIIVSIIWGIWYFKRTVKSWLYYDPVTIEQVCKMVKPEYIKEGYCQ